MSAVWILVTGDPPPSVAARHGGYDAMVRRTIAPVWDGPCESLDARGPLREPRDAAAVVITGSSATVYDREPWMLSSEAWLRDAIGRGTPVLGICFGHQLLAQALGGEVVRNPRGQERGTLPVEVVAEDPLLPAGPRSLLANLWHDDTVQRLPAGAVALARSERDACQLVRFAPRVYGAQFHPEFDGAVLRSYVEARSAELASDGFDPAALGAGARDTPLGEEVLRRFVALAR